MTDKKCSMNQSLRQKYFSESKHFYTKFSDNDYNFVMIKFGPFSTLKRFAKMT